MTEYLPIAVMLRSLAPHGMVVGDGDGHRAFLPFSLTLDGEAEANSGHVGVGDEITVQAEVWWIEKHGFDGVVVEE